MIVEKQLYSKSYDILELMVTDYWNAYHPAGYDTRLVRPCLLYTSPSPRDLSTSRMPSSA